MSAASCSQQPPPPKSSTPGPKAVSPLWGELPPMGGGTKGRLLVLIQANPEGLSQPQSISCFTPNLCGHHIPVHWLLLPPAPSLPCPLWFLRAPLPGPHPPPAGTSPSPNPFPETRRKTGPRTISTQKFKSRTPHKRKPSAVVLQDEICPHKEEMIITWRDGGPG